MQAQSVIRAGTAPTFAAPALSDTVPIGAVLIVKNASGASITVTIITQGNVDTGDAYPDKAYTVAAAGESWIPVDLAAYKQPSSPSTASVTFSSVTSVTAAAVLPL